MGRPLSRARRVLGLTVVPASLVITGLFVSASSYAVFNAKTTNGPNAWNTGTVLLENDASGGPASGTAMFSANVTPGSTGTRCLTVTSTGSVPSAVRLYGSNLGSTNDLAGWLTVAVRMGTATSTTGGACTGFTPSATVFPAAHLDTFPTAGYAGGLGTWSPSGSGTESRVFEFTYSMDSAAPNSTQGGSANIDFVWEAQTS